ncbi:translation initiation factor IF-2 [Streptomyces sp. CBMAI 2042]|nr:translation initiation factor IF-2 [Streptomyces sp. CBMAI 2042]
MDGYEEDVGVRVGCRPSRSGQDRAPWRRTGGQQRIEGLPEHLLGQASRDGHRPALRRHQQMGERLAGRGFPTGAPRPRGVHPPAWRPPGLRVDGEGTRLHEHREPSPVPVHLMGVDRQGDLGDSPLVACQAVFVQHGARAAAPSAQGRTAG